MSGNPFRRSQTNRIPDELSDQLSRFPKLDDDFTPTTVSRPSTWSPAAVPDPPNPVTTAYAAGNDQRYTSPPAGRTDSPARHPLNSSTFGEDDDSNSDSTTTAESEPGLPKVNSRRLDIFTPSRAQPGNAREDGPKAPYNPFARTLATNEASYRFHESDTDQEEQEQVEKQRQAMSRPALDVDDFKNILLTGSVAPSSHAAKETTRTTLARPSDNNSSTDTSSISRHSVFDSAHDYGRESPRNSMDDFRSASSEEEDYENERSSLVGSNRSEDFAPPAPPKTKGKGPQTVSFADFDQDIPRDFTPSPRINPTNIHPTSILRPSPSRSLSDLNKPLPRPPEKTTEAPSVPQKEITPSHQPKPPTPLQEDAPKPKKIPPPPPTSRRQGTVLGVQRRDSDDSHDSSEIIREQSTAYTPKKSEDLSIKLVQQQQPPPPPPARKSNLNSNPVSIVETLTKPSSSDQTVPDRKPVAPPPPRRVPLKADSSANTSRSSLDTKRSSHEFSTGNAPPAPPPRRTFGSKKDGVDGVNARNRNSDIEPRHISRQRFDGEGSTPISKSPEYEQSTGRGATSPAKPTRDILADMTAFQAEIDAMRANAKKEG